MREYIMSTNEFNQPAHVDGYAADCMLLTRLILLEPGTMQSHPEMGVGINTKWRYADSSKLMDLELDIQEQIQTYLPKFALSAVNCEFGTSIKDNKVIFITISSNDVSYRFSADGAILTLSNL